MTGHRKGYIPGNWPDLLYGNSTVIYGHAKNRSSWRRRFFPYINLYFIYKRIWFWSDSRL